jgi:sialic acid synthase SpsE
MFIISLLLLTSSPEWDKQCPLKEASILKGQIYNDKTRKKAEKISKNNVRWIRPGSAITSDYSAARLNLELNKQNRIHKIWCG